MYQITILPSAERDLKKIKDHGQRKKLIETTLLLQKDPMPSGKNKVKKLAGRKHTIYRLRTSRYRIFYTLDSQNKKIRVYEYMLKKGPY